MMLGVYYLPLHVYLVYFSPYFGLTYYNGYGWNFYTQRGGYYDGKFNYEDTLKEKACLKEVATVEGTKKTDAELAEIKNKIAELDKTAQGFRDMLSKSAEAALAA